MGWSVRYGVLAVFVIECLYMLILWTTGLSWDHERVGNYVSYSIDLHVHEHSISSARDRHDEHDLECVGWVGTGICTRPKRGDKGDSILADFSMRECGDKVPRNHSGHCVFRDKRTGKTFSAMMKTCNRGGRPFYNDFSCDQGAKFLTYKDKALDYVEDGAAFSSRKRKKSRGIVFSVGGPYLIEAYANVKWLRQVGCTLPIEFWSFKGELNHSEPRLVELLQFDPLLRLREVEDASIKGWFIKPYALFHSDFDEVLVLDADSFAVRDPEYLFDSAAYRKTGALFFKDRIQPKDSSLGVNALNMIWELLGLEFVDEFEQESGQMVVDRARSAPALHVLMYLTRTFDRFIGKWGLLYGDKDLFRLAWRMSEVPFTYNRLPPGEAGVKLETQVTKKKMEKATRFQYCSGTMVQFDPYGEPLFFHRSLPKIHDDPEIVDIWNYLIKFTGNDERQQHETTFRGRMKYQGRRIWFCAWRKHNPDFFEITILNQTAMEKSLQQFALEFPIPTKPKPKESVPSKIIRSKEDLLAMLRYKRKLALKTMREQ